MFHHPRRSISEASWFTLTPSKVSWASLLLLTVIVFCAGLFSMRHVIVAQERHFLLHGVEHAQRIAVNIKRFMQPQIEVDAEPLWIIESFQQDLTRLCNLETYSAFLLDERTGEVAAHSKTELIGSKLTDRFPHAEPFDAGDLQSDFAGKTRTLRVVTGNGLPALLFLSPVTTMDGKSTRWTIAVEADISDLSKHVKQLGADVIMVYAYTAILTVILGFLAIRHLGRIYERKIEAQLDRRTSQLDEARADAVRKASLAALGKTASMLTHEMRNPLASIKLGLSGILGGAGLNERDRRRLDIAIQEVDRLNGLLSGTLDFVRPISIADEPLPMDSLIDRALATVETAMAERAIHLRRRRCEACPLLRCDPDQMHQALLNLLNNAIEACPQGGQLEIELGREGDSLVLAIANDCEALPGEDADRYFDAFYTTKPKGSGLGLTIVRRIVDEHHGTVGFSVNADGRVEVKLALPISGSVNSPSLSQPARH